MGKQAYIGSVLIISIFFLIGVTIGCVMASNLSPEAELELTVSMNHTLSVLSERENVDIAWILINTIIYPLGSFIFGLTVLGVFAIPAIVVIRGFFLAFSVTAFVRVYGTTGLLMAMGALGVQNLLSLPCLFIVASYGMLTSVCCLAVVRGKGKRTGGSLFTPPYFVRLAVCLFVLCLSAVFEAYAAPVILSAIMPSVF